MHGLHAHFNAAYLEQNGNLAEKAGHIEIYSISDFVAWKDYQPAIMLHELAH
jgi:hypothetical protein